MASIIQLRNSYYHFPCYILDVLLRNNILLVRTYLGVQKISQICPAISQQSKLITVWDHGNTPNEQVSLNKNNMAKVRCSSKRRISSHIC